jgi:hypothetical protein
VRASQAFGILTIAAAAYLVFLLSRYFFPPHLPRYRLESVFFFLIAFSVLSVVTRPASGSLPVALPRALSKVKAVIVFVMLGTVAWLTYRSAVGVGFLSDDFVVADFARRHQWVYGIDVAFARPLVPMLWAALDYAPIPFDRAIHVTNIALHAANALLITMVATRMGMPRLQSVAAGLLFVVSPGLTESVIWATGVHDVLMTAFVLMAVVCASLAERSPRWTVAALAATALAIAAKETGIVTPMMAALVVWASGASILHGRTRWTLAGMFAISAAYVAWRVALGLPAGYGESIFRVYFVKQLIVGPFASLGAPWTAAWAEANPGRAFVRVAMLIALITIAAHVWRPRAAPFKHAIAAAGWVLVGIVPVLSLFYVGPSLEGSRYLYLSAAGFALLIPVLAGSIPPAFPRLLRAPVFVAAVLMTAVPVVPALRFEIRRWHEASRVRDAILVQAKANPSLAQCDSFVATAAADNADGAYVFRHGLLQALASDDRRATEQPPGGGPCRVGWNGNQLTVER